MNKRWKEKPSVFILVLTIDDQCSVVSTTVALVLVLLVCCGVEEGLSLKKMVLT